jgi:hypothetical protein
MFHCNRYQTKARYSDDVEQSNLVNPDIFFLYSHRAHAWYLSSALTLVLSEYFPPRYQISLWLKGLGIASFIQWKYPIFVFLICRPYAWYLSSAFVHVLSEPLPPRHQISSWSRNQMARPCILRCYFVRVAAQSASNGCCHFRVHGSNL